MTIKHLFSNGVANATGTLTIWFGATTATLAATDLVQPQHWNSEHELIYRLTGNTLNSSSLTGTEIYFGGGSNLTARAETNTDGATLFFDAPGAPNRSYIEIMQAERLTSVVGLSATQVTNRPLFMPFWMDGTGLELKTLRFFVSGVGSSNRSFGGTFRVGLYKQVNSTQLTRLASDSMSFSITASSQSSLWHGFMPMDFTGMSTLTITAEGRYVLAFEVQPVSANATWMSLQLWGGDAFPAISRFLVGNTTSATNNTSNLLPWYGAYSTTTGSLPDSVAQSQINGGDSRWLIDGYAILKGI